MVHIVQSSKQTVSYGPSQTAGNTYYEIPAWVPKFGVVVSQFPESVFDIGLKDYEAYDKGRLPFVVDIRAFFRISDSQVAARRVSNFEELKNQLVGVLQGAVRRILATNDLEQIMQDRSELGKQFTEEVDEQLKEWGVGTVKTIEFMDIRDSSQSSVIQNIMAKEMSRIDKESRETVAANNQQAQMKEIEAAREVSISKAKADQEVGIINAEKEKQVQLANQKANQAIHVESANTAQRFAEVQKVEQVRAAEIARDVAVVEAEQNQKVTLVNTQTAKDAAIIQAEGQKEQQIINAEAARQQQVIKAEGERDALIQIAEGNLQHTMKDAEGIRAVGLAKAEAEKELLLAPVTAQTTLAKEIGSNEGYQTYLIQVRQVEASEAVGKEMAAALKEADLKVIANSGNVSGGISSLGDILSPSGGTQLAGMLEALGQTPAGKAVIQKLTATPEIDDEGNEAWLAGGTPTVKARTKK
jgi:flotillin